MSKLGNPVFRLCLFTMFCRFSTRPAKPWYIVTFQTSTPPYYGSASLLLQDRRNLSNCCGPTLWFIRPGGRGDQTGELPITNTIAAAERWSSYEIRFCFICCINRNNFWGGVYSAIVRSQRGNCEQAQPPENSRKPPSPSATYHTVTAPHYRCLLYDCNMIQEANCIT